MTPPRHERTASRSSAVYWEFIGRFLAAKAHASASSQVAEPFADTFLLGDVTVASSPGSPDGPPARPYAVVRQRRTGMPSRWKTSGLVGSRRARSR